MSEGKAVDSNLELAIATVERAAGLFGMEGEQVYLTGAFCDLKKRLMFDTSLPAKRRKEANGLLSKINDDLWNIAVSFDRIELIRNMAVSEEQIRQRWIAFTRVDIQHFHTEFRSIMDFAAQLISHSAHRAMIFSEFQGSQIAEGGLDGQATPAPAGRLNRHGKRQRRSCS